LKFHPTLIVPFVNKKGCSGGTAFHMFKEENYFSIFGLEPVFLI